MNRDEIRAALGQAIREEYAADLAVTTGFPPLSWDRLREMGMEKTYLLQADACIRAYGKMERLDAAMYLASLQQESEAPV